MRIVKCYECGKRYNYDEDGFCPSCGAFNQPPSLSRIGPDGSVIRVEGLNRQNHEGSFVHQEYHAENRKRKGTALEQGEKVLRRPLNQAAAPRATRRQGKPQKMNPIFVIFIIIIVLNLLSGVFGLMLI